MQAHPLRRYRRYDYQQGRKVPIYGNQAYFAAEGRFIIQWQEGSEHDVESGWYVMRWGAGMQDQTLTQAVQQSGICGVCFASRREAILAIEHVTEEIE